MWGPVGAGVSWGHHGCSARVRGGRLLTSGSNSPGFFHGRLQQTGSRAAAIRADPSVAGRQGSHVCTAVTEVTSRLTVRSIFGDRQGLTDKST
jgi:hypothetical protein